MHIQLAWRNIWRNPRRTVVILVAVVIGTWSMLFLGALGRGMAEAMLANALRSMTGHIQVQQENFKNDPVIEHRIDTPEPVLEAIAALAHEGAKWAKRIEVNGVASNARNSAAITIAGIEPDREKAISFYGEALADGAFLELGDDNGIVIGAALADSFDTGVGRKIVLMTQGSDGQTASRAYRIRGVYHAEMESTEKRYAFISLTAAQALLGVGESVTGICMVLPNRKQVGAVARTLRNAMPDGVKVLTWDQMLPLLKGYLGMFDSSMVLWYFVVFVAMAFGIINTTLMAVLERTREFGLLKALGMKPLWIVRGVLTECGILLLLGLGVGNALGMVNIYALSDGISLAFLADGSEYFGIGRSVTPTLLLNDVLTVNGVIFLLGLSICLYPAIKAGRITPVEAMAHT